ncbi:DUF748 domain-containing protein [Paludibacterium sp. dN 18-1]|uniref:DUF748 domain-containing protein n=1 Tax=Paludibacterium denitrificans TaxID=2675226 RepID=A0A844GA75_9NEIS|nr:DUF748 domain-containing protein [Paludibacterium denitrificans]
MAVSSKLGSGTLSAQLALDLAKAAVQGRVTAAGVPLSPVAPYALATTPLKLSDGTLSANLAVAASARNWQVNGQAGINRFKLQEPGQRKPLLGWRQLAVNGLAVQGQPLNVAVREVRLIDPSARLILDAQRQLNVVKLFSGKSAASSKPAAAVVKTATTPVTAPPAAVAPVRQSTPGHTVPVNVRTVRVQGGNVEFADLGMNPNFATHMHRLRGSIQGLSSLPGRRGTVTLDGDVDRYGDVRVRGSLAPLAVTDDTDITLAFRNIPLNSLNPYSMTFLGWKINDGRLTVDLRYLLQQRQLKGQNRVVIDTIQLGDEIPDYKGPHLPLRLAVALLEDSDGRIDLELPVSGNLDDPHFSYGKVIWHAFTNIITKVVTAPFRALGALFGGEGFDDIRFIAGEAAVSPPEREKLDKVAGVMAKRPKMLLQLAGGFDPVVDSKELARARIDRAILQVVSRGVAADEPLPVPDLADPAIQAAVKTVFGQRVGRMRLMTWTLNPRAPSGAATARALHDEMLAKEGVDNTALQALAHARAENAKRVLLRADNTLAERISVLPPVKAKAGQDGVPLEVKLATR